MSVSDVFLVLFWILVFFIFVIIVKSKDCWYLLSFITGLSMLSEFSFTFLAKSITTRANYISFLLFLIFVIAVFLYLKDVYKKHDSVSLGIICFSLPILLFFNLINVFNEILPRWPVMGYLILPILSICIINLTIKFWHIKWFRLYSYVSLGFALFMTIIIPLYVLYEIFPIEKFLLKEQVEKKNHDIKVDITNKLYDCGKIDNGMRKIVSLYQLEKKSLSTYKNCLVNEFITFAPKLRMFCIINSGINIWQKDLTCLDNKYDDIFICNDYFFTITNPKKKCGNKVFKSIGVYNRVDRKNKNFFFAFYKSFNPFQFSSKYISRVFIQKKNLKIKFLKFDHNIFKFINLNLKCKFLDYCVLLQSYFDSIGINIGFVIMLIISIDILRCNKKCHFWIFFVLFLFILIVSSIITLLLKHYFVRLRPLSVFGEENINILFEKLHKNSFPSGHTQLAFTICTFMCMIVQKYWYLYVILACTIGFERIYVGSHFPSDVFGGAIHGVISSYIIVTFFRKYYKA
ncbi:MAG: phosphatase PAP2 family protein [Endomicrobium sp.]|jgi:undecaprenyl-diphosphatase|nr:phosphatase PAP2 family protein [Endomicrobium sp.]